MGKYLKASVLATLLFCSACQPSAVPPSTDMVDVPTNSPASSPLSSLSPSATMTPSASPSPSRTLLMTPSPGASPTASLMPTLTQQPVPNPVPIRAMRVDYPNFTSSRGQVAGWESNMKAAGINMVALGAGRVEWTYFKWAGHPSQWSSPVRDTGIDYLAQDTARFGQWAQVNAVVDVLAPNYIAAHPAAAAINASGVASGDLVSTSELTTGEFGRQLLDMITYIAANYPVNSISLTELFYHVDGYGPDDKALYLAYSGNSDWPRNPDGSIAVLDKSIGDWRTHALDVYLDKIVLACHQYGREFFLDVGLTLDYGHTVDSLNHMTNEHGTNYLVVLQHTDKIVIWGYFSLDDFDPQFLQDVARFLTQFGPDRVILSIGLWGRVSSEVTASELEQGILASQAGGISDIWITPGSLMTPAHWQVLNNLWGSN